jgi:hypothetical protein
MTDYRQNLDRLLLERRMTFAFASKHLGRNASYVQQYVRYGTPKKLKEEERQLLAGLLGVDETLLGKQSRYLRTAEAIQSPKPTFARIPCFDVGASAGNGTVCHAESEDGALCLDLQLLGRHAWSPERLHALKVKGDSMKPTLCDGDDIIVDTSDTDRIAGGIYVLRIMDTIYVKRLSVSFTTRKLTISSDNKLYPAWHDCNAAEIDIVGRVMFCGRKIN